MSRNFFKNVSESLEPVGPLCGKPRPENYDSMSSKERFAYYFGDVPFPTREELEARRVLTPEQAKEHFTRMLAEAKK